MYEEDKNLIAYCGLYCGNCINYKGEIADLARDLRKKLREAKFTRIAQGLSKFFKEFESCTKLALLKAIHEDAHIKNLRNIKSKGINKFLEGDKYW